VGLAGRRALVTGGANGIGRAVVERLIGAEAVVGVLDLESETPAYAAGPAFYARCDVTDYGQVERAVEDLAARTQGFDILVNNAGGTEDQPLVSMAGGVRKHDVGAWDRVIAASLSSVFYVTVNVVAQMVKARAKGVIVNVSSIAAGGNAGQTAYSAAKAGVEALTKTWARELNPLGIRVVGVAPGFTKTGIVARMNPKAAESWVKRIPVHRMAEPEEIADGVLFAITNNYFNGKVLRLDGGLVM